MYNTGQDIVYSTHGLITTVAYKFGDEKPVYALEVGSAFEPDSVGTSSDFVHS